MVLTWPSSHAEKDDRDAEFFIGPFPKYPFVEMWVHDHNLQDVVRYISCPSHCLQIPTLHPCATATLPPTDAHLIFNEKRMFGLVICTTCNGLCIRCFSAAVTKHHDEKQLTERRVLGAHSSWGRVYDEEEGMAAGGWSRKLRDQIFIHTQKTEIE